MTSLQKVATILIGLGEEAAGEILKHLRPDEVEEVTGAIASMGPVPPEKVEAALAEFEAMFRAGRQMDAGGADFARDAVEKALGPEKAARIMSRVAVGSPRTLIPKDFPLDRVAELLRKEHPQVIALLLSRMRPEVAAGVLSALPAEMRDDIAYRIATLGDVAPDLLSELEKNLSAEIRALVAGEGVTVKGTDRAAAILNRAGDSLEKSVLARLEAENPELADRVRRRMFTFEDLADVDGRDLQKLLQAVDRKDLPLAMKLASDRLKDRIFANLSKRVAASLREDIELLGPRRRSEAEEAQRRILDLAREMEAGGQVVLSRGDERKL